MIDHLLAAWPIVALSAGTAFGVVAAILWRLILRPGQQSTFWKNLGAVAMGLWRVEEVGAFFALYRRLLGLLGGYLSRNIGAAALSVIALLVGLTFVVSPLEARRAMSAQWQTNRPELIIRAEGDGARAQIGAVQIGVSLADGPVRRALCWTEISCGLALVMEFEPVRLASAPAPTASPVLLRSGPPGVNPLFPWMSDLEALYVAAFILAMSLAMLARRPGVAAGSAPVISHDDFGLLQLNEQLGGLVRAVGRMEDRRLGPAVMQAKIDRPVFITGLARSGTTVLLNALNVADDVGAHQYADFPFLAAPVTWRAFQKAFAQEGKAVERPHRDRILITKMSPEAFEEPLWQHYFPNSHAAGCDQSLDVDTRNPAFERDFPAHLRKILYLRGAGRYVSKGNYNIGRLGYLARLFPDARFIIPIRAPLDHVASLVRQHELFCRYAEEDPRVPQYLASAGHYEFGPQRQAICLDSASCGKAEALWAAEGDAVGYAWQWAHVYGALARQLSEDPQLARQVLMVRYEDLCADPDAVLARVLAHAELGDPDSRVAAFAKTLSLSDAALPPAVLAQAGRIHELTAEVAAGFGY